MVEDMDKNRRNKFVEIAERRTVNAIRAIRVIGNLSNRSYYEYNEKDVKQILSALGKEIETLRNRLSNSKNSEDIVFRLEP